MDKFLSEMRLFFNISIIFLIMLSIITIIKNSKFLESCFIKIFDKIIPAIDNDNETIRMKFLMARIAFFITVSILSLFLISIYFTFVLPFFFPDIFSKENSYTGPFGDLFNGLVTPVITFLTFCGLLITIIIQNTQMRLTLQELRNSKAEMENSTKALNEQVKNTFSQKIDNNFYSLLNHHEKISNELIIEIDKINKEIESFGNHIRDWEEFAYPEFSRKFFLINYQILKFLKNYEDSGDLSYLEAKAYANITRATLSEEVYALIFINCSLGRFPEYQYFLEHYEFLEHFCFRKLKGKNTAIAIRSYSPKVFGDRINIKNYLKSKSSKQILNSVYEVLEKIKDTFDEYISESLKPIDFSTRVEIVREAGNIRKRIVLIEASIDKTNIYTLIDEEEFIKELASDNTKLILKYLGYYDDNILLEFENIIKKINEHRKPLRLNDKLTSEKLNDFNYFLKRIK